MGKACQLCEQTLCDRRPVLNDHVADQHGSQTFTNIITRANETRGTRKAENTSKARRDQRDKDIAAQHGPHTLVWYKSAEDRINMQTGPKGTSKRIYTINGDWKMLTAAVPPSNGKLAACLVQLRLLFKSAKFLMSSY